MKFRSLFIRSVGSLVLILAAGGLIGWPLAEKRNEHRIRAMLLMVQEGLQRYHVAEEVYPKKPMNGADLVKALTEGGFLETSLLNPWTGSPYLESAEPDWMRYRTNSLADTYELVVYLPDSEEEQFRLDSTEHQSLE
jgi:hypothetical protein